MSSWQPDILGTPWSARTLELAAVDGTTPTATLVRYDDYPGPQEDSEFPRRAIVYIHGYLDYFFQAHLGPLAASAGYQFYGLDLRGYGRNLTAGEQIGFVDSLSLYGEEIDAALGVVRSEDDHEEVVLVGHSTGGLIAALWAHSRRRRGLIDALILNSPWLGLQLPQPKRSIAQVAIPLISGIAPRINVSTMTDEYATWLASAEGGGWQFNPAWKPVGRSKVPARFVAAVIKAQRTLHKGLAIDVPVLVCTSAESGAAIGGSDHVLWVKQMWQFAHELGPDVTIRKISGGVHDLSLSLPGPRNEYLRAVFDWLTARLG